MPTPIAFGKIDVELVSSMEKARGVPEPETPFRIAVLGDFSGRASRGIIEPSLAGRKPIMVDRDNISVVMKKLGVEIRISLFKDGPPVSIRFSEIDDFHPDRLFERLEIFRAFWEARQSLKDPETIAALLRVAEKRETPIPTPGQRESDESRFKQLAEQPAGGLLDEVLEATEKTPQKERSTGRASAWDGFIQGVVAPHAVPDVERQQKEMIGKVDMAIGELMRKVLHHLDFQAIEAAWRSVHFLASRIETDGSLKLYMLDIAKEELASDLGAKDDLRETGMYKILVEQAAETYGGEPWAIAAGNYRFQETVEDVNILDRIAKIAKAAGAPFIVAADDRMLGCESLARTPNPRDWKISGGAAEQQAWDALRGMPEAQWLGLALPRFMLRLPYGAETDTTERFSFEEMPGAPVHDRYLWANPCFACACLLGQAFRSSGWQMRPGSIQEIGNLPLHVYKEEGESRTKPCAEAVLTQEAAEAILEKGFMPLLSFKNRDMIRLARFQSMADPPTELHGRWSQG